MRQMRIRFGMLACAALIVVILTGMEITSLGWCGTRTGRSRELAHFYEHVLGLRLVHAETDLWVFELADGRNVEVFGRSCPGKEHFRTGPVVGFAVRDLAAAVDELSRAGIELLGEPGPTWQHFRGPDGNVYELTGPEHNP
jgi:catechol 2,3-dioxygenase-like lactoylglutathione lyase family enzyme